MVGHFPSQLEGGLWSVAGTERLSTQIRCSAHFGHCPEGGGRSFEGLNSIMAAEILEFR